MGSEVRLLVSLISTTNNPIMSIESAASNCYDSIPSSEGRIMKSCYKSGHQSVLEFAQFHFHIEGISRACSHQLIRHRTGKFAQRSQRYCNEKGFTYITPISIVKNEEVYKEYKNLMNRINWFYTFAQNKGIANEDARYALPNACDTVIDVSFDLRNLIQFMNERLCTRSQFEIRQLAQKMRDLIINKYPQLEEMLVSKCEIRKKYPFCTEEKCCGKHKKLSEVYKSE